MAGWITDGMPLVGPITGNGVPGNTGVVINNGTTISMGGTISYTQVGAAGLIPVDTGLASGGIPQTVAATVFQIAAHAASLQANTATSTAGAATLNTVGGLITTEALTTAPGATYTFTLTDSLILATSPVPQVEMFDKTNTAGTVQVTSVTNAAGSSVFVFTNVGTAAFNGTKTIAFHI
jgi:hypothetical protein